MPREKLANITAESLGPVWSRLDIPTARIAAALGVTRQALSRKAHNLGLPSRGNNQVLKCKIADAEFTRLWLAGVAVKDIRRICGYAGHGVVRARRIRLGLPKRERKKGSGNHAGWPPNTSLLALAEPLIAEKWIAARRAEGARMGARS